MTPRLYVQTPLTAGAALTLAPEQSHYLLTVLRRTAGDDVLLFNGRDGEWRARIVDASRKRCMLDVAMQTRQQTQGSDLLLAFAPIKRQRIDYLVEKATELGVARLVPVATDRTVVERVNLDRLKAHAIEAAEQCGLLAVPELAAPQPLGQMLAAWESGRTLYFCDESGAAPPILSVLLRADRGPAALLTGPEGGFTPDERTRLRQAPFVIPVSLGPRIMRADTAALAALALMQATLGDWGS